MVRRRYALERRDGKFTVNIPLFVGAVTAGLIATRLLGLVLSGDAYYLVGLAVGAIVVIVSVVRTKQDLRMRERSREGGSEQVRTED